jgi:dTDP-4-dehydrorhamnose 3,5-epimerase-like enzyme
MRSKKSIYDSCIIKLNKINDRSGNITVIEENLHLPFAVKRIFYLYDVPGGSERGGHAHYELHQFMVAASGCFDVVLDDGINKKVVELNRPYYGLYIPPGLWIEVINFSSGAISLNLVSDTYKEEDYIRDYQEFLKFSNENTHDI